MYIIRICLIIARRHVEACNDDKAITTNDNVQLRTLIRTEYCYRICDQGSNYVEKRMAT